MSQAIDTATPSTTLRDRMAMYHGNKLKLGLFGANCSSGRAVTLVPERWSGSWDDTLKLTKMADEAGIDFMLPVARWKGYGGDTDYMGTTLETLTWASGLLAATKRLPAMYDWKMYVEAGGLMSYGPSLAERHRRAATYVDKILKGAKPADLPVEQPTKFEFIINLKAAKQIGLTIPPNVLVRADKVIK